MAWESQEPFDKECRVVWWSRLDKRYQIEVQRSGEKSGILIIFDHNDGNKAIFKSNVNLSYGAVFGPDVMDVELWQNMATDAVDFGTSKNGRRSSRRLSSGASVQGLLLP